MQSLVFVQAKILDNYWRSFQDDGVISSFELQASSFKLDLNPTSKISNHRHTGKHMVFIQYLGECESQVWVLSKVLTFVRMTVRLLYCGSRSLLVA
ncbi:hypothetical protein BCS98_09845 [Vibrio breoganii]|nr:hypothetical protein BCT59_09810 [Vibrio breoganii]PMO92499.1 hypothetical protein BCS98_09845 [Vibrio breoganii]